MALRYSPLAVYQKFQRMLSTAACSSGQKMNPLQATASEDRCILVDENDNAVGQESKSKCHMVSPDGKLLLHRAFSVFLFNSNGDLLLQKRAPVKVTYPNYYTNTCCSHPLSTIFEESIEKDALGIRHAAQRRLQIELGIPPEQARPEEMQWLTRIHYMDKGNGIFGEHEIDYIIFLQKDVDLDLNPEEVSEVLYVKRKDLRSFLEDLKAPITPWFSLIVKNQLELWWDNLHQLPKFYDHKTIHRYI